MEFKKLSFLLVLINFLLVQAKSEHDIIRAVMSADLEEVKDCIEMAISPDTKDTNNNSLIMIAVKNLSTTPKIQKQIIEFLLEKKANLDLFNNQKETALTLAIYFGNEDLVALFLEKGAHKNLNSKILGEAWRKGMADNGPGFPEKFYSIKDMLKEAIRIENKRAKEAPNLPNPKDPKELSAANNESTNTTWF
ncbi:ankyrin repeat domain-containing protein [Candidatus Dependentiae bacterium]|nr:ankyrin repeat domain-containing protein [Candidatus Dependentiae bacterium]